MDTIEKIKEHYRSRKSKEFTKWNEKNYLFYQFAAFYRELLYYKILKFKFNNFENLKLLEIGAGSGYNLYFFKRIGFSWNNIYANELLEERILQLKNNFPLITILPGNACNIGEDYNETFDVILQSTVFSSIPDLNMRINLANKMMNLLKNTGLILWYDFFVYNPFNKYTSHINKKEIKLLFPNTSKITFYRTTLASPVARRVGKLYPVFNFFPFLRTHYVAVIQK